MLQSSPKASELKHDEDLQYATATTEPDIMHAARIHVKSLSKSSFHNLEKMLDCKCLSV